jgi:hypothetical protein
MIQQSNLIILYQDSLIDITFVHVNHPHLFIMYYILQIDHYCLLSYENDMKSSFFIEIVYKI